MSGPHGGINSSVIPPEMCFMGWNRLALVAGWAAHDLRLMQEHARAAQDYDTADRLRSIAIELEGAIGYLEITYTPDHPMEDGE